MMGYRAHSRPGCFGRAGGFSVIALVLVLSACSVESAEQSASDDGASQPNAREPDGRATKSPPKKKRAEGKRKAQRAPEPSPLTSPQPRRPKTFVVSRVIDGDTVELGNGRTVRLVGIDTPERGECGFDQATSTLVQLVEGKSVRLVRSDEDTDRYGRLLRYVDIGNMDAGLRLIKGGRAIARYDSRDGYGFHPREPRYIAADRASPQLKCVRPKAQAPVGRCDPGYDPCVPPYPPDVNCADVDGPVRVTGADPHGLDADGDGVACES